MQGALAQVIKTMADAHLVRVAGDRVVLNVDFQSRSRRLDLTKTTRPQRTVEAREAYDGVAGERCVQVQVRNTASYCNLI
jgi:hypothetical protein